VRGRIASCYQTQERRESLHISSAEKKKDAGLNGRGRERREELIPFHQKGGKRSSFPYQGKKKRNRHPPKTGKKKG